MKIDYLLKGVPVQPLKREEIFFQVTHDQASVINQDRPHVGISNLYFTREDVKKIRQQLNQNPGITEGIPFDVVITERGQTETINMYLDLMDGLKNSKDGISIACKMLQSLDWLDDKVDAFTFESMYNETGVATFQVDGVSYSSYKQFFDAKCVYVPYVISSIPNWQDAFLALFGMAYIITELYKVLKQLIQWLTPIPGVGIVIPVAQFILELTFAILLITTLIGLVTQLIACLIQPVKYHGAMLMTDLLKITCAKLGLQEQSSIWDAYPYNQIALLPEKYNPLEGNGPSFNLLGYSVGGFGTSGYTSPAPGIQHGYFNGVGGDFLRLMKSFCNGKIILKDQTNILQLERADYFPNSPLFQLKNIRQDWHEYNTDELIATTVISFTPDLNDKNCIDKYIGTKLQATHQQIATVNKNMVNLKGLNQIQIAAARGINKTSLTFIEKTVRDLEFVWHAIEDVFIIAIDAAIIIANAAILVLNAVILVWNTILTVLAAVTDVLNVIIDAINAIPGIDIDNIDVFDGSAGHLNYVSFINFIGLEIISNHDFSDRINALLLENDMVDVPKLLMIDTSRSEFLTRRIGYLHPENQNIVNASNLWNKFYFINSFVGDVNNRRTIIEPALNSSDEKNPTTLSLADFKNLVSNPQFNDNFGEKVIADSIAWYPEQNGKADFVYRKKGWLNDPQNTNGIKRAQEITVNLKLQLTIPDGQ